MRFDVMGSNGRPRRPTCPPKLQSHWLKYVGIVRPLFAWVTSGVWFSFNNLSSSDLCPVCRLVLVGHILRILLGSWHWGRPELCPLTNHVRCHPPRMSLHPSTHCCASCICHLSSHGGFLSTSSSKTPGQSSPIPGKGEISAGGHWVSLWTTGILKRCLQTDNVMIPCQKLFHLDILSHSITCSTKYLFLNPEVESLTVGRSPCVWPWPKPAGLWSSLSGWNFKRCVFSFIFWGWLNRLRFIKISTSLFSRLIH